MHSLSSSPCRHSKLLSTCALALAVITSRSCLELSSLVKDSFQAVVSAVSGVTAYVLSLDRRVPGACQTDGARILRKPFCLFGN